MSELVETGGIAQETQSAPSAAGWLAQAVGIHAIVAGYAVAQVLPVLIASLTADLNLTVSQSGWLAFSDMGASTVGSLLSVWLIRRGRLGRIMRLGTVIAVMGNFACLPVSSFAPLFALRLISGLGQGIMVGAGTAVLSRALSPQRAFALAYAGQAIFGAVGVAVFPTFTANWGWNSFFVAVAVFAVPALFGAGALPDSEAKTNAKGSGGFSPAAWVAIAAMTVAYLGIGAIWANIGQLGERAQLALPAISYAISVATASAPVGTILAAILGDRVRSTICLAFATLALVAGSALLDFAGTGLYFATGAFTFMFGWALFVPYASGVTAAVDRTGAAMVLATTCAGGGLALGPLLAVPLVDRFGYGAVPAVTITLSILALCLLVPLAERWTGSSVDAG